MKNIQINQKRIQITLMLMSLLLGVLTIVLPVYAKVPSVEAGGHHTVGLQTDETVVAVGNNDDGQCDVSDWQNIQQITAGYEHTIGLKKDGTVVAVGSNSVGQCDVSSWTAIQQVAAGGSHTVGLKEDGTVAAVGYNGYGQCDVSDWENIQQVAAGGYHTVGLKKDGTVIAVGDNDDGQCDVSDWQDIQQVAAGYDHTIGLKEDGTVVTVGDNDDGQCDVSDWQNMQQVAAGYWHTVGLKEDGTVFAVGYNGYGQCDVSDWQDIQQVTAGEYHTVGLKRDGTVVAVGDNYYSQCNTDDWNLGGDFIAIITNIEPDTLNLKSKGKWITCYIELPAGYEVEDIKVDSVQLEEQFSVEHSDIQNEILMVKFNRQDLIDYIESFDLALPTDLSLTVTGELINETLFEGSDIIRIISPGSKGKDKKAPTLLNFSLGQNFPNPHNPDTWIPYTLAKDRDVVIHIYSSSGKLIRTLDLGHQPAGRYMAKDKAAHWDGKNHYGEKVSSGLYFYKLQAGEYRAIKQMLILK